MLASTVIRKLQEQIDRHGDHHLFVETGVDLYHQVKDVKRPKMVIDSTMDKAIVVHVLKIPPVYRPWN